MKTKLSLLAALAAASVLPNLSAQVFNDFEGGTVGSEWGFQEPRFSGSTSGHLALTPNTMQVVDGFGGNLTQVGQFQYEWVDSTAGRWIRLTTFGAAGVPNPLMDLNAVLTFDIYATHEFKLAVGVRETTPASPEVGSDGGTSGGIEWVGNGVTAGAPPEGQTYSAGVWHTVSINFQEADVEAFAGTANGVIDSDWGTLEHLAITSTGGQSGLQDLYVDNFAITPVPEPHEYAMLAGLGLLAFAGYRRYRLKIA